MNFEVHGTDAKIVGEKSNLKLEKLKCYSGKW